MSIMSRLAADWAVRSFGPTHVTNLPERSLRGVEESIELCQSLNVPKDKVLLAVETVYSRPIGSPMQEIGGVLLTANILCAVMQLEPDDMLEMELARVLGKSVAHMAARNAEKLALGLTCDSDPIPAEIKAKMAAERPQPQPQPQPSRIIRS